MYPIHFNHISYQVEGCDGHQCNKPCYVREKYQNEIHSEEVINKVIQLGYSDDVSCNQLTLLLGSRPGTGDHSIRRLLKAFKSAKLHISTRTVDDYFHVIHHANNADVDHRVNISHVRNNASTLRHLETHKQVQRIVHHCSNIGSLEDLETEPHASDIIYPILLKPRLGDMSQKAKGDWRQDYWTQYQRLIQHLQKTSRCWTPDRCVGEVSLYHKKGYTCSAQIGMIHIWPDGIATGCPYDSLHIGPSIDLKKIHKADLGEALYEFRRARPHPIEYCNLVNIIPKPGEANDSNRDNKGDNCSNTEAK